MEKEKFHEKLKSHIEDLIGYAHDSAMAIGISISEPPWKAVYTKGLESALELNTKMNIAYNALLNLVYDTFSSLKDMENSAKLIRDIAPISIYEHIIYFSPRESTKMRIDDEKYSGLVIYSDEVNKRYFLDWCLCELNAEYKTPQKVLLFPSGARIFFKKSPEIDRLMGGKFDVICCEHLINELSDEEKCQIYGLCSKEAIVVYKEG